MTKVDAFEKAWLLAFKKDDFSLFDEIYPLLEETHFTELFNVE